MDKTTVIIDPPIKGQWAILNPPGHPKLAFDFLAVNGSKWPYERKRFLRHVLTTIPVSATYAWGKPVFAPLDGTVVAYSDGNPDRERTGMIRDLIRLLLFRPRAGSPFSAYGGNYVILKCGEVFPLLAHLRKGSVRVRAGDTVRAGDQLGEVGNSGASLQPHLHFQIMSSGDPFPLFKNLLPFAIHKVRQRIGKQWQWTSNVMLKNGDHLLF